MRALLHTSLLAAAVVEVHPVHENALPWLQRGRMVHTRDWSVLTP